jgi:hypothetical protein
VRRTYGGEEITLRSGEELNREWVREYFEQEYSPRAGAMVATAVGDEPSQLSKA